MKDEHPDFNTQAGEQTFVWVHWFAHIFMFDEQSSPFLLSTPYDGGDDPDDNPGARMTKKQ